MKKLNKILRVGIMPAIDKYTVEHEGISSLDLMERAAQAWVDAFLQKKTEKGKVVVMAGYGNNGGDGYAIARLLSERGFEVNVVIPGDGKGMSADCEMNACRWVEAGGTIKVLEESESWCLEEETVVVDALFGIGLNRPVSGVAAAMIQKVNELPNEVFAVDIPSGLMGEDNANNDRKVIIKADYTFTFHAPKLAFLLEENAVYTGTWEVLDIGLQDMTEGGSWFYTNKGIVRELLPPVDIFAHKGTNGRGLLIAGSKGMMGAAVLASKGALHAGIGVLHCLVPEPEACIMQIAVPEAVLEFVGESDEWSFRNIRKDIRVIAVGPGIGQGQEAYRLLEKLLREWCGKTILDADALNLLADKKELLEDLHEGCLLTPHAKEFERLVGKSENDFDRLNKLLTFAKHYKVHIILKGAYSVVATPAGELHFNMSGNPGMAKGGCGDVLTGVLLALAANGMDLKDVARIGCFVHGLAADLLIGKVGMRGITSGMVAENLGEAWKQVEHEIKKGKI